MTGQENLIHTLAIKARAAAFTLAQAPNDLVNAALADLANLIRNHMEEIYAINRRDVESAQAKGLSPALIDRLIITPERLEGIAASIEAIRKLENPVGAILEEWERPNGLRIRKVSVPIGVLGMIYESRPNVTVDAAALALKSRNAIILRGGSESFETSRALHALIEQALLKNGLPAACVCFVSDRDRTHVEDMLGAAGLIDVLIPRGGKGLTGLVMERAKMPVFAHLDGNCHVYLHKDADPSMALSIVQNAKLRRTGICGAAESLLIDHALAKDTAVAVLRMLSEGGVEIVGDEQAQGLLDTVKPATEEDWSAEYLDKKISVKFVDGVEDAAAHINRYGSHHTESIITRDKAAADYFQKAVDSAIVLHNASTQFADGGEFGFGAEIGIGTGKLHARGPVGARQLTTFKYLVMGSGQTRP